MSAVFVETGNQAYPYKLVRKLATEDFVRRFPVPEATIPPTADNVEVGIWLGDGKKYKVLLRNEAKAATFRRQNKSGSISRDSC